MKKNRDKILQTNEYDLLCGMQKNLTEFCHQKCHFCIIALLDGGLNYVRQYCKEFKNCEACIQSYLNMEVM